MTKKASLTEIIAKKRQGELDKLKVKYYHSELLDMDIEVRRIPLERFMSLVDDDDSESVEGMNKIIYECCPMFKQSTTEAMEVYDVAEPTDLPSAILEDQMNEILGIMDLINSFYGADKLRGDIKN